MTEVIRRSTFRCCSHAGVRSRPIRRWVESSLFLGMALSLLACGRDAGTQAEPKAQSQSTQSDAQAQSATPVSADASEKARSDAPPRSELLEVGAEAPEFEAVAHTGQQVSLAELEGKIVVLYFYPKDGTPGCTVEAQQFAQNYENLDEAGAVILGVSSDDNESHRKFADKHQLPFLLLPDTERAIAEAYGVGSFLGMTSRVTYVIGPNGKVAKVYPDVEPKKHAEQILSDIQRLGG